MSNTFVIIALGHALIEGERFEEGLQPTKDSLWGVALVGEQCYTFSGRRTGKMRFKSADKERALKQYGRKLLGTDGKKYRYVEMDVSSVKMIDKSVEIMGFTAHAEECYLNALDEGKIQPPTRVKKPAPKLKIVVVKKEDAENDSDEESTESENNS